MKEETIDFTNLIQEAVDFLQTYEPPEGYFLAFSGGKDSVALYHLATLSGVKFKAFYHATGIDPPEAMKFIRKTYPDITWIFPKTSFWKLLLLKGPPTWKRRWCCTELKHARKRTKEFGLNRTLVGVRQEESYARRAQTRIYREGKTTRYKPIFFWSTNEIWDFINQFSLPCCELYGEGFKRLGCVICPFHSTKQIEAHKAKWPRHYRILDKYLLRLWEKDKDLLISLNFTKERYLSWPNWRPPQKKLTRT